MPTFLYHVLQEAIARNIRCPKLEKIILGGEKAPTYGMCLKLKALAAQLGASQVDVLDDLAWLHRISFQNGVARMSLSVRGRESAGFHLFPDLAICRDSSIPRLPASRWAKAGPAKLALQRRSTPSAARSCSVIARAT